MRNKSIFLILFALILTSCQTLRPSTLECDSRITAVEEGSRVTLRTLENGATAQARLNGVSAVCIEKDDIVHMRIKVGLKIVRDINEKSEAVVFKLPLLLAVLNSKDEVRSYESVSFKMAFPENSEVLYPVINTKIKKPNSGRVVISLAPETLKP